MYKEMLDKETALALIPQVQTPEQLKEQITGRPSVLDNQKEVQKLFTDQCADAANTLNKRVQKFSEQTGAAVITFVLPSGGGKVVAMHAGLPAGFAENLDQSPFKDLTNHIKDQARPAAERAAEAKDDWLKKKRQLARADAEAAASNSGQKKVKAKALLKKFQYEKQIEDCEGTPD